MRFVMTRKYTKEETAAHQQSHKPTNSIEKRLKVLLRKTYQNENGENVLILNETYMLQLAEAQTLEDHDARFVAAHNVLDAALARKGLAKALSHLSAEKRADISIPEVGIENELAALQTLTALITPTQQQANAHGKGAVKENKQPQAVIA